MDKYKELSKQLRYCGDEGKCQSCEFYRETEPCSQNLLDEAADAIEELLKASEKPTGLLPVGTDLDDIVDLGEYFFSINSNMEEKVNDSISRQAAIDALRLIPYDLGKRELEDAIKAVEQLPSAQPEQRWIPCSERLPDDLQEVIVTWINREYAPIKDIPQTGCAVYYGGCWYWSSATCIEILEEYGKNDIDLIDHIIEITAWMPLPEPYKGEK